MDARGADADELARVIADDPAELARFRAAYRGRHDPDAALGWRRDGLLASPEDSARRDRLRRAAFSRDPAPGAAEELAPLERTIAEDAAALDAALAAVAEDRARRAAREAAAEDAEAERTGSEPEPGVGGTVGDAASAAGDETRAPRRRRRILLLSAAAALVLLVAAGMVVPGLVPQRSLDVFDRQATEADRGIDDVLSLELGPTKVRYLSQLEGWDLYAVRFVTGGAEGSPQICLLSERNDVRTGSCVDEEVFERDGVTVETDTIVDRSGGSRQLAAVTFSWGPEGDPRAELGEPADADADADAVADAES